MFKIYTYKYYIIFITNNIVLFIIKKYNIMLYGWKKTIRIIEP